MGASQPTDLFGPDPQSNPLAYYDAPDAAADVFLAAAPDVASRWQAVASGLAAQTEGNLASLQPYLDRHVEDLGLGFRLTGDEQERAWPLNPMPILIGAEEWQAIDQGLVQRAELLESVIADIYGPQNLIARGHLPAAVVSGSGQFARRMMGMRPPGGHFLQVYAADLARGPSGEWRVLSDRVRLPVGIGYALENRLAVGRATGGLLASIGTRRLADFFESLRLGIAQACERSDPRIGLLTPGRFNQSYPEQAHLARHLGFSLVEGRDLVVREDKLYVRTIAGLKRIDALWRWIGSRDIDPLNFDSRSEIGVPNLVEAAEKGLVLVNWLGAGVVESRAMPAFLPGLAEAVLGEPLKLPNVATWWCGGESERSYVLDHIDELAVSSAFRQRVTGLPDGRTRLGRGLSSDERAMIRDGMQRRPMDYTAQEIVSISTTPTLVEGRFEPRGFVVRAFLVRDEQGNWRTLPGGFARVSAGDELRTSLMALGDISADVCIVETSRPDAAVSQVRNEPPAVRREQGLLPSQAADNLYWMGRYTERANKTVRIIRSLIEQVTIAGERVEAESAVSRLAGLLRKLGAVPPESVGWQPSRLAGAALSASKQPGSVLSLMRKGRQVALLLRDRLTGDAWRTIQQAMPRVDPGDLDRMSHGCDVLVERFAALARLTSDGLSRGPAWHFLDMGICIERASMVLQEAQALISGSVGAEDLSALLDLVDAQTLYRSRYMSMPFLAPVLDIVVLDPAQPRGIAFQLMRIEEHLSALPVVAENGMLEAPLRLVRQLRARLEGLEATSVTADTIADLRTGIDRLSDEIGNRYFLQHEEPVAKDRTNFLA